MGVLRQKNEATPLRVEEITYADYLFDDDETDNEGNDSDGEGLRPSPNSHFLSSRRRRQRDGRAERRFRRFLEIDAQNGGMKVKRGMGARKTRRLENARLVYALADPEDLCEDFSDMLPSAVSAFAQLFIDHEKMKAWNEFIEMDEEEQRAVLDGRRQKSPADGEWQRVGGRRDAVWRYDDSPPRDAPSSSHEQRARAHHPAYSASSCFYRLDARFKSLFLQKHLPWDYIDDREGDLRSFFLSDESRGTLWSSQPTASSLHRLILHGVSQYLALRSAGVENEVGERFVEVRNARPFFIPPHKSLFCYVTDRRKARNTQTKCGRSPCNATPS